MEKGWFRKKKKRRNKNLKRGRGESIPTSRNIEGNRYHSAKNNKLSSKASRKGKKGRRSRSKGKAIMVKGGDNLDYHIARRWVLRRGDKSTMKGRIRKKKPYGGSSLKRDLPRPKFSRKGIRLLLKAIQNF